MTRRRTSPVPRMETGRPEAKVQHSIVELLERSGWLVIVMSQPKRVVGSLVGFPDLIAFRHDHVLLVEVKAPGEELRPSQVSFALSLSAHLGGHVHYVMADDVEIVEKRLLLIRW